MPAHGRAAAWTAAALAVASAAVTAWWLAGGTALLDTVGGELESLARDRSPAALLLGAGVVVAKLVAAALALALLRRPARPGRRPAGPALARAVLDAWFLLWGLALVVAARAARPAGHGSVSRALRAGRNRAAPRSTPGGPAGAPPVAPGRPAGPRR